MIKEYKNKEDLVADYPNLMKDMIYRLVTRGKDDYEVDEDFGKTGFLHLTNYLNFDFSNKRYNVIKFKTNDYEEDLRELSEDKILSENNIIKLVYPKFEVWIHEINNYDAKAHYCNNKKYLVPEYFLMDGFNDYDWNWVYQDAWEEWIYHLGYPVEIYYDGNGKAEVCSEKFDIYPFVEKEKKYIKDCENMKNIYDYFIKLTNSFPDGEDYVDVNFELNDIIYEMSSKKTVSWEYTLDKEHRYDKLKTMVLAFNSNIVNFEINHTDIYY